MAARKKTTNQSLAEKIEAQQSSITAEMKREQAKMAKLYDKMQTTTTSFTEGLESMKLQAQITQANANEELEATKEQAAEILSNAQAEANEILENAQNEITSAQAAEKVRSERAEDKFRHELIVHQNNFNEKVRSNEDGVFAELCSNRSVTAVPMSEYNSMRDTIGNMESTIETRVSERVLQAEEKMNTEYTIEKMKYESAKSEEISDLKHAADAKDTTIELLREQLETSKSQYKDLLETHRDVSNSGGIHQHFDADKKGNHC